MQEPARNNHSGLRNMIMILVLLGAAALTVLPVSADDGITISAPGDQSYYIGEEIVLRGTNTISDTTFLFITGPNIDPDGGRITAPAESAVSGSPETFGQAEVRGKGSWEYTLFTSGQGANPGAYTIYAVSQPTAKDQLARGTYNTVSVILKKPFITAEVSPLPVRGGEPFTVTGMAEGGPDTIGIWIIGYDYAYTTQVPVNDDTSFTFTAGTEISDKLPAGDAWVFVQHPMQNGGLDIVESSGSVRSLQAGDGMDIFKIIGEGNLRGRDAAQELAAAISDASVDDTYYEIPVNVLDAASTGQDGSGADIPAQMDAQTWPLLFIPACAIVMVLGIVAWHQRQHPRHVRK